MVYRVALAIAVLTLGAAASFAQAAESPREARSDTVAAGAADVWARARESVGDPRRWVFGSSTVTIETLDRNGETDRTIVLDQSIEVDGDNLILTVTPVSVSSGGGGLPLPPGAPGTRSGAQPAPDPASRMGRMLSQNEGEGGGLQAQVPANPFASEVAESVALVDTGTSRAIGGEDALAYSIAWSDPDGSAYAGTIWFSAATGAPVRLEATGDMAEHDIRELRTTVSYEEIDGFALPARSITHVSRRTSLFTTARSRITVSYGNYFETDGTRGIVLRGPAGQEE